MSGRPDLNELNWISGGDSENAQVINPILPLNHCAAHFGDRGWGNYFWNDLQGRVYVVDLTPEEVATAIKTDGLQESLSVFEAASLSWENQGVWQKLDDTYNRRTWRFYFDEELGFLLPTCRWQNRSIRFLTRWRIWPNDRSNPKLVRLYCL